jgi:hypothetical protein
MIKAGELTVREKFWDTLPPALSATCTAKGNVPAVCGIPESNPAGDMVNPSALPDKIDHA